MQKKALLMLGLTFVLLLGGASLLYARLSQTADRGSMTIQEETGSVETGSSGQQEKVLPPDFTVVDGQGNQVSLRDFVGKPVVVNFWASWCGPCKSEMADFNAAYGELGQDVHFLMVNMTDGSRETVDTAASYVESQGYTFPVYYDTEYSAAIAYGVTALPTTYFFDARGYGVAQAVGPIDAETIQLGIDMCTE